MSARLADLVRKARRLAAERDRLIDTLADEWARALRVRRLSPTDLDELWAGLTEDVVRRAGPAAAPESRSTAEEWRREAQEVIARVREKVEAALSDG